MSHAGRRGASRWHLHLRCLVPAWVNAVNALTGTGGAARKSPVEIFATRGLGRHPQPLRARDRHQARTSSAAGPTASRRCACERVEFAASWAAHNDRVLRDRERALQRRGDQPDPLWVVLGDSTAQGLGAPGPYGGYVGQTLRQLRRTTGQHWRVLNLSVSGALIRDVLADQVPRLQARLRAGPRHLRRGRERHPASAPGKLFSDLRTLLAAVPDNTVMLDLPLLSGFWGIVGRHERPVHHPHQPRHPRGRDRAEPAGRRGQQALHRPVGRASSPSTTSTRARTATATGPGPSSRPSPRAWRPPTRAA